MHGLWRIFWVMTGVWAVVFAAEVEAEAADKWTTVHPGVRRLYRTTSEPNRINVLEVDLCRAGVSVRATKSNERQKTTSAWARSVGAQAAINGDFFRYSDYRSQGLAIGEGAHWPDTKDDNNKAYVAFGKHRVEFSGLLETRNAEKWMRSVVSGGSVLLEDGVRLAKNSGPGIKAHCSDRHPRSMMGLSKDKRTLYLAVVDGRQPGVSRGMLCTEMAGLMAEMGAHSAVEMDGGGSSTMWIEGVGLANRLSSSGGAERVVGNHLGIFAKNSGQPGSCDRSFEESALQHSTLNASTTTDIDGDGKADACSLGPDGLECFLAGSSPPFSRRIQGPGLPLDRGWTNPANYSTIRFGDINGDGKADVCARYNVGMRCFLSTGTGFSAGFDGPKLSNDDGWHKTPGYYSTIKMADFNGDGKDDLCVRSSFGFRCYPSTGNGFSSASPAITEMSNANGFDSPEYYGTIRMGDINGDGKADVCARTKDGMRCWLSDGNKFTTKIDGPNWRDGVSWEKLPYWSSIRMADVNGDGKADLCARGKNGFFCYLSTGNGFGTKVGGDLLPDSSGWDDHDNYSTIQLADINGNGKLDLCARANARVYCYLWNGTGWGSRSDGILWSDAGSWNQIHYYSTIRMADINGDGKADLCGRGFSRFECTTNARSSAAADIQGPPWSNARGWDTPAQYTSIQLVDPPRRATEPDPDPDPDPGTDPDPDIDPDPDPDPGTDPEIPEPGADAGGFADVGDSHNIDVGTGTHFDDVYQSDENNDDNARPHTTTVMDGSCACTHITDVAPGGYVGLLVALGGLVALQRRTKRHPCTRGAG